jgi:septum formation protein
MLNFEGLTLLLASQSPRRRALLKELGWKVKIVPPPNVDEIFPEELAAEQIPEYLSNLKAGAYPLPLANDEMLVTADTIVWINQKVLGKPSGYYETVEMLHQLSGHTHSVFTGVCLSYRGKRHTFSDETKVTFAALSDEEIEYYANHYKPFDKAGGYGVQEWIGFIGVERMEGSYFNVMGLPTHRLYAEIKKLVDPI